MSSEQKRPSPMLIMLLILPVVGLLIAFGLTVVKPTTLSETQSLQINRSDTTLNYPASNFTLTSMTGETVRLSQLRGRVVFLNFWATTCGPCIEELPELQTFAQQQSELENGAIVLAINSYDSIPDIEQFLVDNEITIPDIPVLLDPRSTVFRQYGVMGMPTTFVINAEGMVSQMRLGSFESVESLYAYLPAEAAQ